MISAPLPATSHLLFDASSQANTSGGRNGTSFFMYSSTCFTGSEFTVMFPLASTRYAPYEADSAPTQSSW